MANNPLPPGTSTVLTTSANDPIDAAIGFYYLADDGRTPVSATGMDRSVYYQIQNQQRESGARIVGQTELPYCYVSTVFLSMDHGYGEGPPILFECMVFKSRKELEELDCERCSTWAEAEELHRSMVEKYVRLNHERIMSLTDDRNNVDSEPMSGQTHLPK